MADLLVILEAPAAGLRLAVCAAPVLAREAARRHGLAEGSAGALAQALAGSLLLAATDRPDAPPRARVDIQLECRGPLRGLLVDADGLGAVRGLVRVNVLDRAGERTDGAEPGAQPAAATVPPKEGAGTGAGALAGGGAFAGASAGPGLQFAPAGTGALPGAAPLSRFDARPLLGGGSDAMAGVLSVLRSAPGADELRRAHVAFAGSDLGAGLSAYLRADRVLAGELALEVLFRPDEPLAAVAGAMVLPRLVDGRDEARELGDRLREGVLHKALLEVEAAAPGNAHALAQSLGTRLGLGALRMESELRPRFACRCSRERVVRALRTLGAEELREMAAEDGGASASCDFCAQGYRISAEELLELAGSR